MLGKVCYFYYICFLYTKDKGTFLPIALNNKLFRAYTKLVNFTHNVTVLKAKLMRIGLT